MEVCGSVEVWGVMAYEWVGWVWVGVIMSVEVVGMVMKSVCGG